MTTKAGQTPRAPDDALAYRQPMRVSEVMALSSPYGITGWAVCPRCRVTMDREYMSFCDRCGQRLDWSAYKHATIIYPGPDRGKR